ncbi:MAG: aldehyde dehydrogenase family protein [Actinomycetota bacterium]
MRTEIPTTPASTSLDAPALVAGLRATFASGRTRPIAWRRAQLDGLRTMLVEREQDLLDALATDLAKPRLEAYATEIGFVLGDLDHARRHLERWVAPEKVRAPLATRPGRAWIQREPLGVVLVVAPWNYPVQLTLAPLLGALAAGNAAVVKPSELAPATSAVLARRIPEYTDPDAVAVVQGAVDETTALLAQRWDHIFYTGNGRVGRLVMRAAAEHLTPVTLELGGKSPVVVDRSANLGVAAKRIAWGKYLNAGQTCIAPDYVLCHEAVIDELTDRIGDAVRTFYGRDPRESPDYARIVDTRHLRRLVGYLDDGEIAFGGESDEPTRYVAPTALRAVADDAPSMTEEIFGPVLPIRAVSGTDEAVEFITAREKPLALYVFADDDGTARDVVDRTSSGTVCVNGTLFQVSVADLPFGGVGESGIGAYHGRRSFEVFSHTKGVLRRATRPDPALAYPPYSRRKERMVRRFL